MKQHISPKQAQEITEEQFYSLFSQEGIVKRKDYTTYHHKKVTIGKCIERLYQYDCDVEIVSGGAKWYVACAGHINTEGIELIDVLWEAVKKIIYKE